MSQSNGLIVDLNEMIDALKPQVETLHSVPCNGQVFVDASSAIETLMLNNSKQTLQWLEELREKQDS